MCSLKGTSSTKAPVAPRKSTSSSLRSFPFSLKLPSTARNNAYRKLHNICVSLLLVMKRILCILRTALAQRLANYLEGCGPDEDRLGNLQLSRQLVFRQSQKGPVLFRHVSMPSYFSKAEKHDGSQETGTRYHKINVLHPK
jgi:hypothetical protein